VYEKPAAADGSPFGVQLPEPGTGRGKIPFGAGERGTAGVNESAAANRSAVVLPPAFNYIGCFLTFACPYQCSYCINRFGETPVRGYRPLPGAEWISFFQRLETNAPITLQGGEPGSHPDFISIVRETLRFHSVDILTNLTFDLDEFIAEIDPRQINREAPYAPIRVSYHPEQFSLETILGRVLKLQNAGFRVGLYGVEHPDQLEANREAANVCEQHRIDFRLKPFLGWHDGVLHGTFCEPDGLSGQVVGRCECAPSELLIAPDGSIHRCHHYIYNRKKSLGQISDSTLTLSDDFLLCDCFGLCNPCDLKFKNNRFQQFGHVAMKLRNIERIEHCTTQIPQPTPASGHPSDGGELLKSPPSEGCRNGGVGFPVFHITALQPVNAITKAAGC
jgi:hypothetical protein